MNDERQMQDLSWAEEHGGTLFGGIALALLVVIIAAEGVGC